jgi:hypothetical protein
MCSGSVSSLESLPSSAPSLQRPTSCRYCHRRLRVRVPAPRRHKDRSRGATRAPVWRSSYIPRAVRPVAGMAGESFSSEDCSKPSAAARLFLHEAAFSRCAPIVHSAQDHPGNPAVVGFAPLDRKFCDARLSTGCAFRVAECESAARVSWCNACARHAKCCPTGVAWRERKRGERALRHFASAHADTWRLLQRGDLTKYLNSGEKTLVADDRQERSRDVICGW